MDEFEDLLWDLGNLFELREKVRDYHDVESKADIETISYDIEGLVVQLGEEKLGSEIIKKLEDLKRKAYDFLNYLIPREEVLRSKKLDPTIHEIETAINEKITNTAMKLGEVV